MKLTKLFFLAFFGLIMPVAVSAATNFEVTSINKEQMNFIQTPWKSLPLAQLNDEAIMQVAKFKFALEYKRADINVKLAKKTTRPTTDETRREVARERT